MPGNWKSLERSIGPVEQSLERFLGIARARILRTLYDQREALHVRALAEYVDITYSAVHREVAALQKMGLVAWDDTGDKRRVKAISEGPLATALRDLCRAWGGLPHLLAQDLAPHTEDAWIFIYGSYAQGQDRIGSDVDVMVVSQTFVSEQPFFEKWPLNTRYMNCARNEHDPDPEAEQTQWGEFTRRRVTLSNRTWRSLENKEDVEVRRLMSEPIIHLLPQIPRVLLTGEMIRMGRLAKARMLVRQPAETRTDKDVLAPDSGGAT